MVPLPPGEIALFSTSNKKEQIDLGFEFVNPKFRNSLIIAESADTPVEVHDHLMIQRYDLTTTDKKAHVIIIHQCYKLIQSETLSVVKIISDDTEMRRVWFSLQ